MTSIKRPITNLPPAGVTGASTEPAQTGADPVEIPFQPPAGRPTGSAIDGIVPIGQIGASAPVDKRLVDRINEISAQVIAAHAGKGANVLASVVNILDMIAPVAVSLLPAAGDDAGTRALKEKSMRLMKQDLKADHLGDAAFVHQLQVIHAQLLQFKGMITLGNSIVLDSGSTMRAGVTEAVEKAFDTKVKSLPMKSDPNSAAQEMSDDIKAATTVYGPPAEEGGEPTKVKDGLKDVVKPDFVQSLDAASVATFTALLDWRHVFDESLTSEADVKSASGSTEQRELMTLKTGGRMNPATQRFEEVPKLEAAEFGGFVFAKLPYDDKQPVAEDRPSWMGPPPSKIYRIVGAPHLEASARHQGLAGMVGQLASNDPLSLQFQDRHGSVTLARVQTEAEADPFELLGSAGVNAGAWAFPLLDGDPVQFTKGIHKGAVEDTEKGTIIQFVTVGGLEATSIDMTPPFELKTDVPYYNAIVVELSGPGGERIPLKVAEWTIENFADTQAPTSNR